MLVKEGVFCAGLGIKMAGVSNCCCLHVLDDEPRVDVVGYQDLHDCWDILVLPSVGTTQEAHHISCMHLVVKECCQHGHCVVLWDCGLLLPKWVLVCNPCGIIRVALDKHLYHVWNQDMGII